MGSHWPAVIWIGSRDIDCSDGGGTVIVGGTVGSTAGRGHTHPHINISRETHSLPSFVLCRVVIAPPLMPLCSPGEAKPAVPSEAHPIFFLPLPQP